MKITSSPDQKQIECVDITMTITMPLEHWKVVAKSLSVGTARSFHVTSDRFLDSIMEAIQNYEKSITNEFTVEK